MKHAIAAALLTVALAAPAWGQPPADKTPRGRSSGAPGQTSSGPPGISHSSASTTGVRHAGEAPGLGHRGSESPTPGATVRPTPRPTRQPVVATPTPTPTPTPYPAVPFPTRTPR